MNHSLSIAQLNALRAFADVNGRTWKFKLNHAWSSGRYRNYGVSETYGGPNTYGYLQQIRNEFGPTWLVKFRFDNVKTHNLKF